MPRRVTAHGGTLDGRASYISYIPVEITRITTIAKHEKMEGINTHVQCA